MWPGQKGQGSALSQALFKNQHKLTSPFGQRTPPQLGGGRTGSANHPGVDFGAPTGTNIYAPWAGKVERHPRGGFMITRADGHRMRMVHSEALQHVIGRTVQAGIPIGRVGPKDHLSTGAHAHVEYYINGKLVNPLEAFKGIAEGKETKAVVRDNRDGRIKMERRIDGPMMQQASAIQQPVRPQQSPFLNALLAELYKEVLG